MYPGGNTCYGFHSFYDNIVSATVERKIVLKGGPGVGKSTFMKNLGEAFAEKGYDIEYHWCSSDNNSLDAVVIGNQQICVLDGTSPHVVDPEFPGAVDEIINLGRFWDKSKIKTHRKEIVELNKNIHLCFVRAYNRLKETSLALEEWKSYYEEALDITAVNRNIIALARDFLKDSLPSPHKPRHLFAGAITPQGLVTKVDSIIDQDCFLFAVKGNPGTGQKELFRHALTMIDLHGYYAEIYHNPFNPNEIDFILLPQSKAALIDISGTFFNYPEIMHSNKYKRLLDFDQFLKKPVIDSYTSLISAARERFYAGLRKAVAFIHTAKKYHDELEQYYIPAMDFDAINDLCEDLFQELFASLQ